MYLSSKEAAELLKRGGRTPDVRDLRRWVRDGYRVTTPAGVSIVKLRAVQLPGGISFTQQQIDQFVRDLTAAAGLDTNGVIDAASRTDPKYAVRKVPPGAKGTYPTLEQVPGRRRRSSRAAEQKQQ